MFFLRFQSLTGRRLQTEIVGPEWEVGGWVSDEEDLDNSTCCGVGETLQDASDMAFEALARACGMKVQAPALTTPEEFLGKYGGAMVDIASRKGYSNSCISGFWCFDGTCPFACGTFLTGEAAEDFKKIVVLE